MARLMKAGEALAVRRRVYCLIFGATDGMTPALDEEGGQPELSTNGGEWTAVGVTPLRSIGRGRYYTEVTAEAIGSAGDILEFWYKGLNTAEAIWEQVQVVAFDPATTTNISEELNAQGFTVERAGRLDYLQPSQGGPFDPTGSKP